MSSSDDCRYWCHQCNEPVWPQGPDSLCPYCDGGFVQEMSSRSADANSSLIPPWLTQHADTVRSLYNNIFHPTTDPRLNRRIRPPMIPVLIPHHLMPPPFHGHSHDPRIHPRIYVQPPPDHYHHHVNHDPYQHHHHYHDEPYMGRENEYHHHRLVDEDEEDELLEAITQMSMNDEALDGGGTPASASAIRALPTIRISERHLTGDGKCPVCQEKFRLGSSVRQMPCDHIFHPGCIVPWLELHNTCPICRFELSVDESSSSSSMRTRGSNARSRNPLSSILP